MRVNQLKAGVILTYLTTALSAVISLLYTPIMLDILGQSEYGVYTLVNSVVANLGILSFGFGSAYIRFYSQYKVKNDEKGIAKLNGMFILIFSVIALIAFATGAVLVQNTDRIFKNGLTPDEIEKAKVLLWICIVNISISFPASVFTSYITANERYVFLKAVNMIKMVFSPFITLPVLLLGFGSVGMVVTTLVINIFADILNITYSVKKLDMRFNLKSFEFKLLKSVWVFSFFIFLNIITDQINWNVDKFLLGMFQSSAAVAIYGVAAQLNNNYTSIFWSLSNVFIPRINKIVSANEGDDALTELFIKIGRIQFMVLSLILEVYLFFGKYFISVWAGKEYFQSYIVGLILIFSVTIEGIQTAGIEMQRAKNMHKFRSVVCFSIAIINILLSIPLCIRYGAIGASIGTAASLICGNGIIMNIYYHKKIGINVISFWKSIASILPAMIIPTLYGVFVYTVFPIKNIYVFMLQFAIMVLLYSVSIWLFGMNKAEREMIISPFKRMQKRGQ